MLMDLGCITLDRHIVYTHTDIAHYMIPLQIDQVDEYTFNPSCRNVQWKSQTMLDQIYTL